MTYLSPDSEPNSHEALFRELDAIADREPLIRLEELNKYNEQILNNLGHCMEDQSVCVHDNSSESLLDRVHLRPFALFALDEFSKSNNFKVDLGHEDNQYAILVKDNLLSKAKACMIGQHTLSATEEPGNVDHIYKGKVDETDVYFLVGYRQQKVSSIDDKDVYKQEMFVSGYRKPKDVPEDYEWMFPPEPQQARKAGSSLLRTIKARMKPGSSQYQHRRPGFHVE